VPLYSRGTILSFSQPLPTQFSQLDSLLAHRGDPLLASQQHNLSPMWNHKKLILQGLRMHPHCWSCPIVNMMQMVTAIICRTWEVQIYIPPLSLKSTESSWQKGSNRIGQANYSVFNMWKKVCMAWFLEKQHCGIICGQNDLTQLHGAPPLWETVIKDFWATFDHSLRLDTFHNASWICQTCIEMFLRKIACDYQKLRTKGRQGERWPVIDLAEDVGNMARSNLQELS